MKAKTVKPSNSGLKAEKALQTAVARMAEQNRKLGLPVAVMSKGRAVLVPVTKALHIAREKRAQYN